MGRCADRANNLVHLLGASSPIRPNSSGEFNTWPCDPYRRVIFTLQQSSLRIADISYEFCCKTAANLPEAKLKIFVRHRTLGMIVLV
jgi:hypothetical protein